MKTNQLGLTRTLRLTSGFALVVHTYQVDAKKSENKMKIEKNQILGKSYLPYFAKILPKAKNFHNEKIIFLQG